MTASNDSAAPGTSTTVATTGATASSESRQPVIQVSVLLYSDDITTRDAVRVAVGRRPARDVEVVRWHECATADAVISAVENDHFDILILDGEAAKVGGLGLARQLKNEIFECPPIIVLTGRPQDSWLAAWSQADLAVPHPLDPIALSSAVATLARASARVRTA
ncbi:response regulator [Terrabacter sp. BE26]|uniref:response regulator n=1 Tax=Terrabacter sp. BE26 TaxID=2898152 RepID=UPI0035BEA476